MAHHRRKKTRRQVRCTICTPWRWMGNHSERFSAKEKAKRKQADQEIREHGVEAR